MIYTSLCDFNSRICEGWGYGHFDKLLKTMQIDTSEIFIEFLKDTECCILSGHFKPNKDNYTCTSTGNTVVLYIVVSHDKSTFSTLSWS